VAPGRQSNQEKGRTEYPRSGAFVFFHLKSGLFWPTLKAPTRVRGGDGTEQAIDRLGFSRAGGALWPRSERSIQMPRRERGVRLTPTSSATRWAKNCTLVSKEVSVVPAQVPTRACNLQPYRILPRRATRTAAGFSSRSYRTSSNCSPTPAEAHRAGRNSRWRRAQLRSGARAIETIPRSGRPAHKEHRAASQRARPPQVRATRTLFTIRAAWPRQGVWRFPGLRTGARRHGRPVPDSDPAHESGSLAGPGLARHRRGCSWTGPYS